MPVQGNKTGADYPQHVAIDLDAGTLTQFIGVYRIDENQTRSVMLEDGRLYTQRTGGGRMAIAPYAKDAFFYPGSFTYLKFVRDNDGRVVAMDMHQGGAGEAERAEWVSDLPADERKALAVSA